MDRNTSIQIVPTENGFMVRDPVGPNVAYCLESFLVFQSMAGLVEFLKGHFTHRAPAIPADNENPN